MGQQNILPVLGFRFPANRSRSEGPATLQRKRRGEKIKFVNLNVN